MNNIQKAEFLAMVIM